MISIVSKDDNNNVINKNDVYLVDATTVLETVYVTKPSVVVQKMVNIENSSAIQQHDVDDDSDNEFVGLDDVRSALLELVEQRLCMSSTFESIGIEPVRGLSNPPPFFCVSWFSLFKMKFASHHRCVVAWCSRCWQESVDSRYCSYTWRIALYHRSMHS